MELTTYDDWLPNYPVVGEDQMQSQLAAKKEFQDVSSLPSEPPPANPGDLFRHQELVKRYMRVYDRLYMVYEAGTGKTCGYVASTEDFKQMRGRNISVMAEALSSYYREFPGRVRHVYVLLKGPGLISEFRKQLLCTCTPGTYLTDAIRRAKTEKLRNRLIASAIKPWYTVMTYTRFTNWVRGRKLSSEQLKAEFSGCYFVCDEIHALQTDIEVGTTETEHRAEAEEEEMVEIPAEQKKVQKKKDKQFDLIYTLLWNIFHLADWVKVILCSATPQINDPNEIIPQINLLLPADRQVDVSDDVRTWSLQRYREVFMGYVSFIRAGDTGVDIVYAGAPLPDDEGSQYVVKSVRMSAFQERTYNEVVEESKNVRRGRKGKGFQMKARQASLFVYPDAGTAGSSGADE